MLKVQWQRYEGINAELSPPPSNSTPTLPNHGLTWHIRSAGGAHWLNCTIAPAFWRYRVFQWRFPGGLNWLGFNIVICRLQVQIVTPTGKAMAKKILPPHFGRQRQTTHCISFPRKLLWQHCPPQGVRLGCALAQGNSRWRQENSSYGIKKVRRLKSNMFQIQWMEMRWIG